MIFSLLCLILVTLRDSGMENSHFGNEIVQDKSYERTYAVCWQVRYKIILRVCSHKKKYGNMWFAIVRYFIYELEKLDSCHTCVFYVHGK